MVDQLTKVAAAKSKHYATLERTMRSAAAMPDGGGMGASAKLSSRDNDALGATGLARPEWTIDSHITQIGCEAQADLRRPRHSADPTRLAC